MTAGASASRYLRTVAGLRPAQGVHRLRLRGQRAALGRLPATTPVFRRRGGAAAPGWPAGFAPMDAILADGFPNAEDNAEGRFRFLEDTREIGAPDGWQQLTAGRLWRYHLHYFEWAWAFSAHPDRDWARDAFARLWRSWRAGAPVWRGDPWSPYVVSLRAWAWCGAYEPLVAGSAIEAEWLAAFAAYPRFVRAFLELDVGGNHLVKNLKALLGLGVFFGDERLRRVAGDRLEEQLAVQVLADGGHYERSPSYHCQVLGDLLDVQGLLAAAGLPPLAGLGEAIAAMRRWLGAMLMPDGDVPMFNDCVRVGRRRIEALEPTAPATVEPLILLQPSGYAVMRGGDRLHLVADVGVPCPSELPAHAHADCLSFELAVDGERAVVDTGVSTYDAGPQRAYERSTAAHNTVEIDGADQTEVWGVFRAARRAKPTLRYAAVDAVAVDAVAGGAVTLAASHDGYERLRGRPRHLRTWRVTSAAVEVTDEITGAGAHRVTARFHLTGDAVRVSSSGPGVTAPSRPAQIATGFGQRQTGEVIEVAVAAELPVTLRTRITPAVTQRRRS